MLNKVDDTNVIIQ